MRKIEHKKPDPVPVVSWTWDEGRYWDLWMFVHVGSGVLIAVFAHLIGLSPAVAYAGTLIGMILWECGEVAFGIREEWTNLVLDVVFGMAGFALVYEFVAPLLGTRWNVAIFIAIAIALALFEILGWKAYRKRATK